MAVTSTTLATSVFDRQKSRPSSSTRRSTTTRGRVSHRARATADGVAHNDRPHASNANMLKQKTVVQKNVVDAHRELQEWHASDEGKAMVESIAPAGTMSKDEFMDHAKQHVTTLGEQPDTLAHTASPTEPHEIDQTTRWVIATFLNRLVHIPLLNPMTEQIICVKAVDLIADTIERELHRTGAHHFFRDASEHEERGDLDEWLVKVSDDLNLIIDVPLLDEKQEYDCIHAVLSLITHQYLEKKKRDVKNNPIKHKWVLLINMLG